MFMKMYPSWFVMMPSSLMGVFLIVSGDNWFMIWTGFELTLFSFLPLFTGGSMMFEGMIKYFLTQAGGSSIFVLSFLLADSYLTNKMVTLSMLIKLGLFPFYMWVPLVMSTMTWYGCALLLTIQKVGPLCVLWGETTQSTNMILSSGCMSILIGGLMGYNQSFMRPLMSYSSISHSGWMVLSFSFSFSLFILYMMIYFLMVMILFSIFSTTSMNKVVTSGENLKSWSTASLMILVMSGVPPFSMFYLKASIIYYITQLYLFALPTLLGTMLSTYFYFTFVTHSLTSYWTNKGNKMSTLTLMTMLLAMTSPILLNF